MTVPPPNTDPASTGRGPGLEPRSYAMLISGVLSILLVSLVSMVPMPFALMSPGPVENVLSGTGSKQLIQISGHKTYPTKGTLDLLTVSVSGGPGQAATVWSVVQAWADPDIDARPVQEVFPANQNREQVDQENTAEMVSSQQSAAAAALSELGIPITTRITVGGFAKGAPAKGVLKTGDEVLSVNGTTVTGLTELRQLLGSVSAGQQVQVSYRRNGKQHTASLATMSTTDDDGTTRTILGVIPALTYGFPFSVKIQIEDIGGPSAGMMFSLGIIDKLTPGAITGGNKIAGTGTMDSTGAVGAIGGIRQKLVGAANAGATWFLAPAGNCNEVVGHVPQGLRVVKVATLHEARQAVETIGSGSQAAKQALPTCTMG